MRRTAWGILWLAGLCACTRLGSPATDAGMDLGPGEDPGGLDPGSGQDSGGDQEPDVWTDPGGDVSEEVAPWDPGRPDPGSDPGDDLTQDPGWPLTGTVEVAPFTIEFSYVPAGGEARRPLLVRNRGPGALEVSRLRFSGSGDFAPDIAVASRPGPSGAVDYDLSPARVLAPNETWNVPIVFRPTVEGDANGEVRVFTSDPDRTEPAMAFLRGNLARPCLRLRPESVDFGAVTPDVPGRAEVRVESCGQMDLRITGVALGPEALKAGVTVSFARFGDGTEPTDQTPVVLPPGTSGVLDLAFDPVDPPAEGAALRSQLSLLGNQFFGVTTVPLSGTEYAAFCAQPVIRPLSESPVPIGSVIHAAGADSHSPFGSVNAWSWAVDQPEGNGGVLVPSDRVPEVALFAGAVGTYRLRLQVGDDQGNASCGEARWEVEVTRDQVATVSATWRRADGGNPIPGQGPDVDLHFLYPAAGTDDCAWYSRFYDCNPYNNPDPDPATWGGQSVRMVSQSPDGRLPEAVRMDLPSCPQGRRFRFGVHYFASAGAGRVDVTLAVHLYGQPAWTRTVRLREKDLWDAAVLTCGSGTEMPVVTETPGPRILANFAPCP
ncbi:MAG TPA: hypothetical protein PLQ97_05290 [Myxococcota bacterium]|mgnify:CR=1 FL=1|nr:hypothetical protein [Myxococcota bacterium]HQK52195.1 hypothetical protein [Myxococcota bacterium]